MTVFADFLKLPLSVEFTSGIDANACHAIVRDADSIPVELSVWFVGGVNSLRAQDFLRSLVETINREEELEERIVDLEIELDSGNAAI